MDVDQLNLPKGTHAAVLTDRCKATGIDLAYPIVWADRPYRECPLCGQTIDQVVSDCPVILDAGAGGAILEWDKKHGCGEWLFVDWRELDEDATDDDVLAAAEKLANDRREEIQEGCRKIEAQLREDLAAAVARLAEPLEPGETREDRLEQVRTGNEIQPGVYLDGADLDGEGGYLVAWDYHPDGGEGDTITVTVDDLVEADRG